MRPFVIATVLFAVSGGLFLGCGETKREETPAPTKTEAEGEQVGEAVMQEERQLGAEP